MKEIKRLKISQQNSLEMPPWQTYFWLFLSTKKRGNGEQRGPIEIVEMLPRGREMFKYTCRNLTMVRAWSSREISISIAWLEQTSALTNLDPPFGLLGTNSLADLVPLRGFGPPITG